MVEPVVLAYPFVGRWRVENSPARRVPSHGTHLMGTTYAIDFVPVDEAGRSAPRTWRSLLTTEPPDVFVGFGRPVLAPVPGTVVASLDGEPDGPARRSVPAQIPFALGQGARLRAGPAAIAGNHVVVAIGPTGPYVLLAHLQRGSVLAATGDQVRAGQPVGRCGSSGNSTEPHVHVQVSDGVDWPVAKGVPLAFVDGTGGAPRVPDEREVVEVAEPAGWR